MRAHTSHSERGESQRHSRRVDNDIMASSLTNTATPKRSVRLQSKRSALVDDSDANHNDQQSSSGMSLDVLAHVASETLKQEPRSPENVQPKKVTVVRGVRHQDQLSLGQIQGLTEKTIINLFTEPSSNDYSRTFSYKCMLIPKQCDKTFTSYGSDIKARSDVKKHLYEHLSELEQLEAESKIKFYGEPVPARQKRLQRDFGSKRNRKNLRPPSPDFISVTTTEQNRKRNESGKNSSTKSYKEHYVNNMNEEGSTCDSIGFIPMAKKLKVFRVSEEDLTGHNKNRFTPLCDVVTVETVEEVREKEEGVILEMLKVQPFHDHCYTTVFGERKNSDDVHQLIRRFEQEEDRKNLSFTWSLSDYPFISNKIMILAESPLNEKGQKPMPILFLRHRSLDENVPMVSKEEIIDLGEDKEEPDEMMSLMLKDYPKTKPLQGQKPYPPMPKSFLARRGRLGYDICDMSDSGEEEESSTAEKINPFSREGREGNLGWEPKLAMKYIKELKGRKKGENIALKCKICKEKTFTATATLIYHYRSHAGFKPFVCLICNTTFTRQHSLNYHMLIHNNQSRFTCKDCGRKFRHPSHFKEHLRRHTGETPFACSDCWQRFKTRNTYKRHLKTRHGKLLTASGIYNLTKDEFDKVRTRPIRCATGPSANFPKVVHAGQPTQPLQPDQDTSDDQDDSDDENVMTESDEQKMILEELKADIKKEVGSESDSDQELSNILQVLSSTCDPASNPVVVKEETEEGRVNITGVTGVIIKTEPVPAQLYVNNHVGATEAC